MNNKQRMAIRQAITDIYFNLLDQIDTAYNNVLRAIDDGSDDLPSVWVDADGVLPSVTIEFGSVVYEFNPSEADEWQSDSVYDYHYDLDNNEVCVYRVVDGDTDTSNTIHKQPIKP